MPLKRFTVAGIAGFSLAACAGGSGGGSSDPAPAAPPATSSTSTASSSTSAGSSSAPSVAPPPSTAAFTSFSAVQPNQTVVMAEGISYSVVATVTQSGAVSGYPVTNIDGGTAQIALTYDENNELNAALVAAGQSIFGFRRAPGASLQCSTATCPPTNATGGGLMIANNHAFGWDYQTFGIWATASGPNVMFGAISAGAPTPIASVPTAGGATFTGFAAGYYVDPAGAVSGTVANMTANVDFSNRSILFGTTGTVSASGSTRVPTPGLDLAGTLAYNASSARFGGQITTANGQLSGTATGQFYGPNAEEIGGTYGVGGQFGSGGTNTQRMFGAFGGKR